MKLLTDKTVLANPFDQFDQWFKEAKRCKDLPQPQALCLSTLDLQGYRMGSHNEVIAGRSLKVL